MWLEVVLINNRLAWADGRLVEPLEVIEVKGPLRFGEWGRGGADLEWDGPGLQVTPDAGGLVFTAAAPAGTLAPTRLAPLMVSPGGLWPWGGFAPPAGAQLRVLAERREGCAWPREVPRPAAPWTEAVLSVFADQLLEGDFAVERRFHARDEASDATWSPVLDGIRERNEVAITWRRGVADSLRLRPLALWGFGRSLAQHAVFVSLRTLELVGDSQKRTLAGLIAGGGLPCLQSLRCEVTETGAPGQPTRKALRAELEALPGFRTAFPALTSIEVVGVPMETHQVLERLLKR